jgi:IS4 transposase
LVLLTSLGTGDATPDQLLQLYRKRWQIEIAFKRLKSLIRFDRLPAKEPRLAKAWLCAHLILAIFIDAITPHLRDSPPSA